ncbi:MAG: hydrolase [Patescibacteria group bacterium]
MKKEEVCCPKFDPTPWDEKEFIWKDKLFIKDTVKSFMHIPLNVGPVMQRMWKKVQASKSELKPEEFICLSEESSPWKSTQYMAVSKEVADAENVKLSGTYLTKVFEGPYKDAPNWHKEMTNYIKGKGKEAKNIYFYYTTCPKCAKKYGKNYVVLLAEI